VLLHELQLNHRAVFQLPELILMLRAVGRINFDVKDIFQDPTCHLKSSTNVSLAFKTRFNSDTVQSCRPTLK